MMKITNKTNLKYTAVIVLIFSVLLCLRWAWSTLFYTIDHPKPVAGVLDLRGYDLEESSSFYLDGEWQFYPGQLLSSGDIASQSPVARSIRVPGDWSGALHSNSGSSYGYGTYRIRILIDPLTTPVGFWLRGIQASSQVEINGIADKSIGQPATQAADYTPKTVSYTGSYSEAGTTEIELVVRVANFDQPYRGGMVESIRFGSVASIDYVRWYSVGFQLTTFLILLLHGLYACILYLFNRQERALLMTFFLLLTTGIVILSRHENILLLWLPINYAWAVKIKLLSLLWQNLLILLIFRRFASAPPNNRWLRLYTAALIGYCGFVLAAPVAWINATVHFNLFLVLYLLAFCWFIYTVSTMVFQRKTDSDVVFLVLTAAGIISNLTWSILENDVQFIHSSTVYYPIDIIVALIGFSTYWFKKYFRNARENARLNVNLREADKLKDQFLANTSHELRTPLHGIMNIAQNVVTKERSKLSEQSVRDMDLLITVSRRMSYMLNDLLDAAQLQEHRIVLRQEPLHIQSLVPGIMAMLRFMIQGKPVQLRMDIVPELAPVLADEQRVVQILYNLLHNAIQYTEQGTISVFAEIRDGRAVIHVSDTGVGMDKETQTRVFLPYEQGAHGISDGRGIGLGLSISKQLVELHGGQLTVHSVPRQGSVFSFDLPLAETPAATPAPSIAMPDAAAPVTDHGLAGFATPGASLGELASAHAVPPLPHDGNVHILAVDDDPVNLNVLVGILSTEPYSITTAQSAQEALRLLHTRRWDLLITDVMMPQLSGYELTQRVREQFTVSELPILLLTARNQPADIYTGFASGANDYVAKPVDALELKYRIQALIALKQSIHERLRMEAAYLQAQIHPHFLFNTLNSLLALSDIDTERMQKLGYAFASYLRVSFDYLNTVERVDLSHELKLVEAYLYIEQERFEDRLSVVWNVEPGVNPMLPPLSIQPLVENAVRHGLLSRNQGGTLQLRISRREGYTLIEVEDNGKGMEPEYAAQLLRTAPKGKRGIGLSNTNRRLIQLYGKGLMIQSAPNQGTKVSFAVPNDLGKRSL